MFREKDLGQRLQCVLGTYKLENFERALFSYFALALANRREYEKFVELFN